MTSKATNAITRSLHDANCDCDFCENIISVRMNAIRTLTNREIYPKAKPLYNRVDVVLAIVCGLLMLTGYLLSL